MSIKLLEEIGLSEEQAKVYDCLVSLGTLQARKIAMQTQINRSLVYRILKQLIEFNLVAENTNLRSISTFSALHPSNLHAILKKKEADLKMADQAFHEVVSTLGSHFNLVCGKPTVRFYEGIDGINILNKDIIHTKEGVRLIRSPLDNNTEETDKQAKKLLEDRARIGIKTKLIVPIKNIPSSIPPEWDNINLIERRRVPREELYNTAQVIVYGKKVAFTSFGNCMITTIIEDEGIAETCGMLFESLWVKYSEKK